MQDYRSSSKCDRREFLQTSAAQLSAATLLSATQVPAAAVEVVETPPAEVPLIDVNVYFSRWPFRRLQGDEPGVLVEMLRGRGVVQAWVGSFDGVFHKDISAVNERLVRECDQHGDKMLIPFGTINPTLPDWEGDLERCHTQFSMPGIRLFPNYHRYDIQTPECQRLLEMAAERNLIVQLVPWLEDERHQHPLMPVPEADLTPLPQLLASIPNLQLMLLNGNRAVRGRPLLELMKSPRFYCDIALVDVIDGLATVLERMPATRVVFGSYFPMFYFDSARLKLKETLLEEAQVRAITHETARRLLQGVSKHEVER